jgi:zinc/manganese transport system substrate-binding protein
MAREIAGDAVEVQCLVPVGTDLHGFDPTPRDIAPLLVANLVVANGAGFEPWLDRFLAASGYTGPVVKATDGCALITADDHVCTSAAHDHAGHNHGEIDPHAWQDPANAVRYVANIRDALCRADPAGAENYRRRARLYTAQIEALDAWARRLFGLVPAEHRVIVTSHDSLAYFGRAYGLEIVPLRGIDTRAEPDARQIAEAVDQLRSRRARAVFVEAVSNPRLLEQIARDASATLGGELFTDSLAAAGSPADSYLGMVRENTLRIVAAIESR